MLRQLHAGCRKAALAEKEAARAAKRAGSFAEQPAHLGVGMGEVQG